MSTRTASAPREFLAGVGTLFRGFGLWRRRPGLMLLGLVPALIVAAVIVTVLVLYLVNANGLVVAATPFADDWPRAGRDLLRFGIVAALLVGIVAASVLGFTAFTLVVGDPFYERIWRAVEAEADPSVVLVDPPFWRTVGDALALLVRGAVIGLATFAVGLVPIVGGILAAALGVWFSGQNLARELTGRPLEARGLDRAARRALLRRRRARVAGFGIATYLLFLVPGGAVVGMAPAIVGATALARALLVPDAPPTVSSGDPRPQAPSGSETVGRPTTLHGDRGAGDGPRDRMGR